MSSYRGKRRYPRYSKNGNANHVYECEKAKLQEESIRKGWTQAEYEEAHRKMCDRLKF
jgi:hypothetical protein